MPSFQNIRHGETIIYARRTVKFVLCIDSGHNNVKGGGGGGKYETFPIFCNFRTFSFEINQNSVRISVSMSYFTNKEF